MKIIKRIFIVAIMLAVLGCAYFAWKANNPQDLPAFPLCPSTPNCVSSLVEENSEHYIEPLTFSATPEQAWTGNMAPFKEVLLALPRSTLLHEEGNKLVVSYESRIFGFEDQLAIEVRVDGTVHVRSASRVGYSDLGVNRERVESLREQFAQLKP